jgi:Ca2+/H+ antiporter
MAERRTKVYHGLQAQQRDEADAVTHGWRVVTRDSGPEGYRVTYELGSGWERTAPPPRRRGLRKSTWLVIIWNVLLLSLLLLISAARGYVNGTYDETITRFAQSALLVGLGVIWLVGFLVTGLIWLASRPRG